MHEFAFLFILIIAFSHNGIPIHSHVHSLSPRMSFLGDVDSSNTAYVIYHKINDVIVLHENVFMVVITIILNVTRVH